MTQLDKNSDAYWQNITKEEWEKRLTKDQVRVCRESGTERAGTGEYVHNKQPGVYHCSSCDLELFRSEQKFDSGTGWPSFYDVLASGNVELHADNGFFMKRTEVRCRRCQAHLGHVFDDGPPPTHKRYCINSVCLKFAPSK